MRQTKTVTNINMDEQTNEKDSNGVEEEKNTAEESAEEREGEEAEAKLPPHQQEITYEDFAKLDIRIGTIVAVDVVKNADKLLKLTVDLGEMDCDFVAVHRQIISGIREFFDDPYFLVGKQCPFVANLAPRTIRGYESQGMIMAASTEEAFALLNPHVALPAGTKVN